MFIRVTVPGSSLSIKMLTADRAGREAREEV